MDVDLKLSVAGAIKAFSARCLAAMILMAAAVPMEAMANGAPDPEDRPSTPWLTLNQEGGKIVAEIPNGLLNKDFLIWKRYPRAPIAKDHQVARWTPVDEGVALYSIATYRDSSKPLEGGGGPHLMGIFPSKSDGGSTQVDLTSLFYGGPGVSWFLGDERLRRENRVLKTSNHADNSTVALEIDPQPAEPSSSVIWNFIRLPADPLPILMHDRRSGFDFMARRTVVERYEEVAGTQPANRRRVDGKSRPSAGNGSKRQIVIHVDPATPERWKPWVMKGINAWREVFSKAGIPDAIVAVDPGESSDFSYDDLSNSVVCWWLPEHGRGKKVRDCGWWIIDPRTGEILQTQISGPSSAPEEAARYMANMMAVDKGDLSAESVEDIIGRFVQRITTHEVAHMLGVRDGNFGTLSYSVDEVRSPEWVKRMGFSASIVNYVRFNNVAQPEDGFTRADLVQGVGPADLFSVLWAYGGIDFDELESGYICRYGVCDGALPQRRTFKFNETRVPGVDASSSLEALGLTERIEEANLALLNLERSMRILGEMPLPDDHGSSHEAKYISYESLYEAGIEQWGYIVRSVASLIGGEVVDHGKERSMDQRRKIPTDQQRSAAEFMCRRALSAEPYALFDNKLRVRAGISMDVVNAKLRADQKQMLWELVRNERIGRLGANEIAALLAPDSKGDGGEFGLYETFSIMRSCPMADELKMNPSD